MKVFSYTTLSLCIAVTSLVISVSKLIDAAIPFGIFPLLSTGWYYKPGPLESIVLGLIVVKVLAIRLGATLAGVPYHLNDIFDQQKLINLNERGRRDLLIESAQLNNRAPLALSATEIEIVERMLLALRRIDSHDCFIQYICRLHQRNSRARDASPVQETWLNIFRLRTLKSKKRERVGGTSVWTMYETALFPGTNCTEKYASCPLTSVDLETSSILSGMY